MLSKQLYRQEYPTGKKPAITDHACSETHCCTEVVYCCKLDTLQCDSLDRYLVADDHQVSVLSNSSCCSQTRLSPLHTICKFCMCLQTRIAYLCSICLQKVFLFTAYFPFSHFLIIPLFSVAFLHFFLNTATRSGEQKCI